VSYSPEWGRRQWQRPSARVGSERPKVGCSSWGGTFDLDRKREALRQLEERMAAPGFWNDQESARAAVQSVKELKGWIDPRDRIAGRITAAFELDELLAGEPDESMSAEVDRELTTVESELDVLELRSMLRGPDDFRDAQLEISAGAGGTEAQDWAQMLMRMYLRYCERVGFKAEVVDLLPGEEAGIKSATIEVTGDFAYGYLRGETGVHRLVRISPFDASRRRQTSFASVAVVPEVDDVEVNVREDDLRVDVFRSSGPGGQGVNTADSAVRITHLPTNIVVSCQNERSQLRNRDTAMRILKARLYEIAEKKQREELTELTGHKKEIAFGSQIRSYTFHPYQLIKDHRTGLEVGNVDAVMDGDLEPFVKAFLLWARERAA
jgi:peptide chain release factor 2